MTKKTSNRFSPEVRERAARMMLEHGGDHASQWAAIGSISATRSTCGRDAVATLRSAIRSSIFTDYGHRSRAGEAVRGSSY
jgi:transposase-like protein